MLFVFLEACYGCFCFYMCLFDCKCKNINRLGENINEKRRRQQNIKKQKLNRKASRNTYIYIYIYKERHIDIYIYIKEKENTLIQDIQPTNLRESYIICLYHISLLSFCIYNRKSTYNKNNKRTNKTEKHKT